MQRPLRFLCAALLTACAAAPVARADTVAYEGFDYAEGADLSGQTGGSGFSTAWTATGGDTAGAGSLAFTDALGNALLTSGNRGLYTGAAGTSSTSRDLPAVRGADDTTTWISFLGQRLGERSGDPATFFRAANISLFNSTLAASQEQLAIGEATNRAEDTWSLVPDGSGANTRASATPFDQLSLVVVRIDHLPGADTAYLFLNPNLGGDGPDISLAEATATGDFSFNRIRPFAGNPNANPPSPHAEFQIDELRVGTTYADVTPVVPEPAALALLGAAVFPLLRRRR